MQVKEKIRKYYSEEEFVTIASSKSNEWMKILNSFSVFNSLRIGAAQRLVAVCELIRVTSFKYEEWKKWYSKPQASEVQNIDLRQFLSKFNITIVQPKDDQIVAIKSFANFYKAVVMTEIATKDEKKKEQFLNDYSLYLCWGEFKKFYDIIRNEKIDDSSARIVKNIQQVIKELFYANNIKQVAIETELLQMLTPKRFRDSSLTANDFEGRNPFESDYFRIVTSAPIRRLQDKTQIFPQEKSDFVRRRLTHSMEVASVGRHLGLMVEEELIKKGYIFANGQYVRKYSHSIATILETAGLVHDIGNPPFGHFGEDTIQQYFKKLISTEEKREKIQSQIKALKIKNNSEGEKKVEFLFATLTQATEKPIDKIAEQFKTLTDEQKADFTRFDGNVQGLRNLRHLGLSTDHNSFNLTMPTLAAIIKYPFPSNQKKIENNHSSKKYGYYQFEKTDYDKICATLHLQKGKRHPLAYLLEAADDIVNVTSDVEDGFKMGIISIEEIKEKINALGIAELNFDAIVQYEKDQAEEGNCCVGITDELLVKEFRIRAVHSLMVEAVQVFVTNIRDIMNDCYLYEEGKQPKKIANSLLGNELLGESNLRNTLSELQKETYRDTYVLKSELLGEHVITEMLNKFIGCMFSPAIKKEEKEDKVRYILDSKTAEGKLYALISSNYKRAFDCEENEVPAKPYDRFLLAVDHVSGMTDSYIVDLYNELTNRKR